MPKYDTAYKLHNSPDEGMSPWQSGNWEANLEGQMPYLQQLVGKIPHSLLLQLLQNHMDKYLNDAQFSGSLNYDQYKLGEQRRFRQPNNQWDTHPQMPHWSLGRYM